MRVEIHRVDSRRDLKAFQTLPWSIYKNDDRWIPPLISQERSLVWPGRHPFHEHALTALFLAVHDGRPAGRIGVCVNEQHNLYHGEQAGFFGFFESTDDQNVASALIDRGKQWLAEQRAVTMRGPFNWSTNETCGLLVEGFQESPRIMMPYNPRYYGPLLEGAGMEKAKDLVTFELSATTDVPERMARIAARSRERAGVVIRTMVKKRLDEEVGIVKEIYNAAWSRNWGFVPMTSREVDHMADELKPIIDERLALFAEIDGKPAGFCLTLPDFNQVLRHLNGRLFPIGFLKALWYSRKVDFARLITLGIKEEYRRKGIEAILIIETLLRARKAGYIGGELGWVLEDNRLMIRDIEAMGAKRNKLYRIYETSLS